MFSIIGFICVVIGIVFLFIGNKSNKETVEDIHIGIVKHVHKVNNKEYQVLISYSPTNDINCIEDYITLTKKPNKGEEIYVKLDEENNLQQFTRHNRLVFVSSGFCIIGLIFFFIG